MCYANRKACKSCYEGHGLTEAGTCARCAVRGCRACDGDPAGSCQACRRGRYLQAHTLPMPTCYGVRGCCGICGGWQAWWPALPAVAPARHAVLRLSRAAPSPPLQNKTTHSHPPPVTTTQPGCPQPRVSRHEYVLVSGQTVNGSVQVLALDTRVGLLAPLAASRAQGPAPSYLAWRTNAGPVSHVLGANRKAGGRGAETLTAVDWAQVARRGDPPLANLSSIAPPQRGTTPLTDSNYVEVAPSGRWALTAALAKGQVFAVPLLAGPGGALSLGDVLRPSTAVGKGAHMARFSPCGRCVYSPIRDGDVVRQFAFSDSDGALVPLGGSPAANAAPLPPGYGPRHIAFHPTLPVAYVVNEFTPSVAIFSWDPATGRLSADWAAEPWRLVPAVPAGAPPGKYSGAEVAVSLGGRFVYASTRGLTAGALNVIGVFAVDAGGGGALAPLAWEQGGGDLRTPRHFSLTTGDRFLLAANQAGDAGGGRGRWRGASVGACCAGNGSGPMSNSSGCGGPPPSPTPSPLPSSCLPPYRTRRTEHL